MKKKLFAIVGLILVLSITSCTKWIDPEINKDPDRPTEVPMSLLLPSVEVNLGYVFGGFDVAGATGIWLQYLRGTDRQALAYNTYNITESDVNNLWNDIYTGPLMDLKDIMAQADAANAVGYKAVSEILTAYTLGTMTGLFGDIPYTDALNGYPPVYDSEQDIYNIITDLLDDAIQLLDNNPNVTVDNDFIYAGDMEKWKAAAYTMKARFALRISNVQTPNWNDIIDWVDNGIASINDDMEQPFGPDAQWNNPMYQFYTQRSGYISDNTNFVDLLNNNNDPRVNVLTIASGYWTDKASSVRFVSYTEGLFIKAEAYYRSNNENDARQTLLDAVEASLNKLGVFDNAWFTNYTNYVNTLTGTDLLNEIILQKYIDGYLNAEIWADYRRLYQEGSNNDPFDPFLTPTTGDQLPDRFPYPTDETSYNPNTPNYGSIFSPLWFTGRQ